jgi:hypothetical protein
MPDSFDLSHDSEGLEETSPSTIPFHPLANVFPLIEGEEFFAFCEDIKVNGQQEAIILHGGMILDGRNRYRALQELGIEPMYEQYTGQAPLEFVLSKNMYRRQLTVAQRSIIAAEIVCRGAEHTLEGDDQNIPGVGEGEHDSSHLRPGLSLNQAATLLGISERSISSAGRVARSGVEELLHAVKSGKVKISAAEYIAKLDHEKQRELCALGNKAIRETAREMREERRKKDAPAQKALGPVADLATAAPRPGLTDSAEALFNFALSARKRGGNAHALAEQICNELAASVMPETETIFFAAEVANQVRERLLQRVIMDTSLAGQ